MIAEFSLAYPSLFPLHCSPFFLQACPALRIGLLNFLHCRLSPKKRFSVLRFTSGWPPPWAWGRSARTILRRKPPSFCLCSLVRPFRSLTLLYCYPCRFFLEESVFSFCRATSVFFPPPPLSPRYASIIPSALPPPPSPGSLRTSWADTAQESFLSAPVLSKVGCSVSLRTPFDYLRWRTLCSWNSPFFSVRWVPSFGLFLLTPFKFINV